MSASKGSASWRTRLRRKRGSVFVGSTTGVEPERRAQRRRLGPPQGDDRMPGSRGQGGETVDAGAPQDGEEHRLGAVVGGVTGGVVGREDGAAGGAGAGFEVGAVGDDCPLGPEGGAEAAPQPSATTPASPADPGRRPWSTCTAVTSQPAAHARASSASESGPPETAHVSCVPGGGNAQRSTSRRGSRSEPGVGSGAMAPDSTPHSGS